VIAQINGRGGEKKMGKRSFLFVWSIIALFAASSIHAGTTVPDIVKMDNKAYSEHQKGIVEFSHKKHVEAYKAGCGDCHHDENNKPLTDLKAGDEVQNCIECHKIAGEKPKGKDAPKLTRKQELEYHAEAVHDNCRGCHKKHNKEKGLTSKDAGFAPVTCKECHPKK
jgi:cytochrome c553